jgi:transcriptional regulator of arginine metabolism
VLGIREGAAIVVIHTRPGAAPAVAALLDQTRLDSIIGSIAGDDTIFIVPERRVSASALAKTLRRMFQPPH